MVLLQGKLGSPFYAFGKKMLSSRDAKESGKLEYMMKIVVSFVLFF